MNKAEDYFKKSFGSITDPVDHLEYHYTDFLLKNGETEKVEPEAIERINEIKKN